MHLTLIRHGIAEDKSLGKADFDRALTNAGRNELVARFEQERETLSSIDIIYCSPSVRTRQTCDILCSLIALDPQWIMYEPIVYETDDYRDLLDLMQQAPADKKHVCLIGHNDSISELASYLAGKEVRMKKGEIRNYKF